MAAETFRRVVAESDMVSSEIARLARKRAASGRLQILVSAKREAELQDQLPEFNCERFEPAETILREGDVADRFYLLVQGTVEVSRRGRDNRDQVIATLRAGNYFGETGLIYNAPRNATVTASGKEPVIVYSCDRVAFDRLVREAGGPSGDLAMALAGRLLAAV